MKAGAAHDSVDLLGSGADLERLLDVASVQEILGSFYAVFRIPVRILSAAGGSFANSRSAAPFNEYLATLPGAVQRVRVFQARLRQGDAGEVGEFSETTFTGATYHVGIIGHEGRRAGRFILGPFITPELADAPRSFLECDPALDAARARALLLALPRVRSETIRAIARHLAVTLDVLMFTSQRAVLTEHLHLSTVQENQRQLSQETQRSAAAEGRLVEAQRLVAALSSEWTQPLAAIRSSSGRLMQPDLPQGEPLQLARSIQANAEQLLRQVRRWVEAWSFDGSRSMAPREVDVRALIERACDELRAMGPGPAPDFRVECAAGLPCPRGDASQLVWVLVRLGDRASQLAPQRPIGFEARCVPDPAPDNAGVSGALVLFGAPRQVVQLRIGDLAQARPAGTQGSEGERGSGGERLEWATIQRVIEGHRGKLRVEGHPGVGLVFVITLPLPDELG